MKASSRLLVRVFLLLTLTSNIQAQDIIQLDESDINRLGIILSTVRDIDNSTGAKFPATVINSPLQGSEVITLFSGILESWKVTPGTEVEISTPLAEVRSQALLDLQNQWMNAQFSKQQLRFEIDKDESLLAQGIISKQRFIKTENRYQQAEFESRLIEAKLTLAGFDKNQRLSLLENRERPGIYILPSPATGTVSHLMAEVGSYIEVNQAIASISGTGLWLVAELPARIGSRLQVGQTLRVEGSNSLLNLRQKDLEVAVETQTITIHAEFLKGVNMLPGQAVYLMVPANLNGVLIPANAVVHSGDTTSIFIKRREGFEIRPVNLLPAGSDYIAVEGVQTGEQVVIRGASILKGIQLGLGGE